MLEWHEGDNPSGAVNQQERPIGMIGILRDYTPNTDDELAIVGEDIVPSAWRHAGANVKGTRRSFYVDELHRKRSISEIPCRVSNIAQDGGNTAPTTGSNRWNPHDVSCRDVTGNTEGKIRGDSDPRNDSGVRSLDGR
jgi:hypothetical protein